jgi:hypothetical protein
MAAVVVPQPVGHWQHRPEETIHIPNLNMSGLLPTYDPSRTVTHPPHSRTFQATTTHMDMNMPLFTTHPLTTSVPYQSGAFAFESLSVNPYSMQQAYPVTYPTALPQNVSYPGPDARTGYSLQRHTPPVKSEANSPIQPDRLYNDASYSENFRPSETETGDGTEKSFATDVDTLMKAIQAKQNPVPQRSQSPKVCYYI